LVERVTGADLVPALAAEASRQNKSLYFLGGEKSVAENAAQILQERCPGLRIAGIDSPFVYTEGEALADADEVDMPICERINESGADILLVAFGNPKQELWFRRNQDRLRVPVVIGIGGTFNFIAGTVSRAPAWMQRIGAEWLYRVWQEPRRLWKRYLVGLLKFATMISPAVLDCRWKRLAGRWRSAGVGVDGGTQFLGGQRRLQVLGLPARLDRRWVERVGEEFEQALFQDALVLDFSRLRCADITGLGMLVDGLGKVTACGKLWYAVGLKSADRRTLKLNRVWDLLEARVCRDVSELVSRLRDVWPECGCWVSVKAEASFVVLGFCGRLAGSGIAGLDVEKLLAAVVGRNCLLDLSYCARLDSRGLALLLRLRRAAESGNGSCLICGATAEVEQTVKAAKLTMSLRLVDSVAAAKVAFAGSKV
jgi:exopolysaccharide biosynthesis WecB/TagA/CpsF family protein